MIPRIRGKLGQIEEPLEDKGKWVFALGIWDLNGEKLLADLGIFGPYETEVLAKQEMKKSVRDVVQGYEKFLTGTTSERYLDLKNGAVLRSWDDSH